MFWVIAVIVVIVWIVAGGTSPASGSNGGVPQGQGCDACKGLDDWWRGLSLSKKLREFAWYWSKKADCALKGCKTS
jgi:hypothetical protein